MDKLFILITAIIVIAALLVLVILLIRHCAKLRREASELRKEKSEQLEKSRKLQASLLLALIKVRFPEIVVRSEEHTGKVVIKNDKKELTVCMPANQFSEIAISCVIDGENWSTRKTIIDSIPLILKLLEK